MKTGRMTPVALNHMTMPNASTAALLDLAARLGCVGVELRNDLKTAIFDGKDPAATRDTAQSCGLRILALAEVYGFNDGSDDATAAVRSLARQAVNCGAEAVALIPRLTDGRVDQKDQRKALKDALVAIQPILDETGIIGLIECLGFPNSSLRMKSDAVAVLDDLNRPSCFRLIHDTFHHALAGETQVYPELTRIVHISGVVSPDVAFDEMTDAQRGLVDGRDRLGNVAQIAALQAGGFDGPLSVEAFAPEVHAMNDPAAMLSDMFAFINAGAARMVA